MQHKRWTKKKQIQCIQKEFYIGQNRIVSACMYKLFEVSSIQQTTAFVKKTTKNELEQIWITKLRKRIWPQFPAAYTIINLCRQVYAKAYGAAKNIREQKQKKNEATTAKTHTKKEPNECEI